MESGLNLYTDSPESVIFINPRIWRFEIHNMSKLKEQFKLGEAFGYFFRIFRKEDPSKPTNFNIKTMHVINKISIMMFLMCVCVMIYRAFFR